MKMGSPKQILCLLFVLFLSTQIDGNRPKRMFALCPPHFIRIGNECYFISQNRVNWLDAHFECKDRNSRLAEPFKQEDRFLRKYLNHYNGLKPADLWIAARYNWEKNKWQWGYNGRDLTYQSFSQMSASNRDLKFNCAILNPNLRYRWSASSCVLQHQYICQHRMPYVTEKNRQKIYNKWNETYPNEMANEIEVVLSEDDLLRRRRKMHRSHLNNRQTQLNHRQTLQNHRQAQLNHRQTQLNDQQTHMNNRPTRVDPNAQNKNDIPINQLQRREQQQKKLRAANRRSKNHRFELNRTRASGTRQRIQFNSTTNWNPKQFVPANYWRQKQKQNKSTTMTSPTMWSNDNPSTTARTMAILTSTPTPTQTPTPTTTPSTTQTPTMKAITTSASPIWLSNDVVNNDEEQMRKQNEIEQRHNDEEERRKQEYWDNIRRIEEERIRNEELARAAHIKELDRRRQQFAEEQKQRLENDRIQEEKKQQDAERREQIEMKRIRYNTEQAQLIQQRKQQENHDTHAIQTNEILDNVSTTTISSIEKKRLKNKILRDRLSKLSPDEQNLFYKRREERHKKRGAVHDEPTEAPYSN